MDLRFLYVVVRRHPLVVLIFLLVGVAAQILFALNTDPEYLVEYSGVVQPSSVNVLESADDIVDNPRSPWQLSTITAETITDTLVREVRSEQGAQLLANASIEVGEEVEIDLIDGLLVVNTYATDPEDAVAANRAVVNYLRQRLFDRQEAFGTPIQAYYTLVDINRPAVAERDDGDKLRSMVGALGLAMLFGLAMAFVIEGWQQSRALAYYKQNPSARPAPGATQGLGRRTSVGAGS